MASIIDTFVFFDELELLEFRLKELDAVADIFVLVESDLSFSGREKPLFFAENKHRFSAYGSRIVHIVHEASQADSCNAWDRETMQRNAILQGLEQAGATADDYVLISDCDEVPRPDLLLQIRRHGFNIFVEPDNDKYLFNLGPFRAEDYDFKNEVFGLLQEFYYYNLECRHAEDIWWKSRILTYRKLLELGQPDLIRRLDLKQQYYGNAGWHFSYFGGVQRIANKIRSFSHQEYNIPEILDHDRIEAAITSRSDLFDREFIKLKHIPLELNGNLPENYEMLLNFN